MPPGAETQSSVEAENYGRGQFGRRLVVSLVAVVVFIAAALAAGDHGHGTLMNVLGIPLIVAGVSAIYALAGVVSPRAGRWIDKQQR